MVQKEAKRFLRKYATISIVLQYTLPILFAVFAFCNIYFDWIKSSYVIILGIFLMFLTRMVQFWYRAKVEGIALNELNPPKMKAVLEAKGLYAYMPSRFLTAHFYNGDYQETIDICACMLKNKKERNPWAYYYFIAGVYFQLGDIDGLKAACERFEAYRLANPKIDLFCPLMKLYKLYANEGYEELKKLYDSEEKSQYNKATYMLCEYIHAVNFYTLGEKEKAKEIFESISKNAPLLNVGKLSLQQLECIEQGKEYEINKVKILPDESYKLQKSARKANTYHNIRVCCYVLIIIMLVIVIMLEVKIERKNKEAQAFENELYGVIDEDYNNFDILAGFNVEKNDKTIEYMVVFENESNQLVVGYYVWLAEEQKNEFIADCENVIVGKEYNSDSPCSDYTISYKIFDSKGDLPSNYYEMKEFKLDDKKLYICVTSIY